jgi:TPR repeat protein
MFISRIIHAVVVFFVTFAAHQGNAAAQVNLGSGFALGHFGEPDLIKAREWLEKAAAQGHSKAKLTLLHMNAEGGDAAAQVELGWSHFVADGARGSESELMARHWWEKAAAQGNADAEYKLGVLSTPSLESVPRDFTEALEWYKKAAAHGSVSAQESIDLIMQMKKEQA